MTAEPNNIANMNDERLIRDGEMAATAYARAGRENILPMARGLVAARRKYRSNEEFGRWFDQSSYPEVVTNHSMRAALIYIGEHEDIAAAIVQNSRSIDPEAISETIQSVLRHLVSHNVKPEPSSENLKTAPVPPSLPESAPPPPPEPEKTEVPPPVKPVAPTHQVEPVNTARSALRKIKPLVPENNIQLIHQYVLNKRTRTTLADVFRKKTGRPVLGLLLDAIQSGAFGPPIDADVKLSSIRLLMPWLDGRQNFAQQDITQPHLQRFIRDYIFPVLAENPALITNPNGTSELNRLSMRRRADDENKARERTQGEQRQKAVQSLPSTEQAVIAYGKPIWPPVGDIGLPYTYKELCHAIWYWRYFLDIARQEWRPKEIGMSVRHLTKYLAPLQPGFHAAIREVSGAFEEQPEAECTFPMIPVNF